MSGLPTSPRRPQTLRQGDTSTTSWSQGPKSRWNTLEKLNMQDAVRLHDEGDQGRLLAMSPQKIKGGYALQGKPELIEDLAELLDMTEAKPSLTPECYELLEWADAKLCRACTGKVIHLSHHRPELQHAANAISRYMGKPTKGAMRKLKRIVRFLLGSKDTYG